MNLTDLKKTIDADLADNAFLLLYPDIWLQGETLRIQVAMTDLIEQLTTILSARRIKNQMRQQNVVPVRRLETDNQGGISDYTIDLMPFNEAVSNPPTFNQRHQERIWACDGYSFTQATN